MKTTKDKLNKKDIKKIFTNTNVKKHGMIFLKLYKGNF